MGLKALRAGQYSKENWPFETPWEMTEHLSRAWAKADSGRFDSQVFALIEGDPPEVLLEPREITPAEWLERERYLLKTKAEFL